MFNFRDLSIFGLGLIFGSVIGAGFQWFRLKPPTSNTGILLVTLYDREWLRLVLDVPRNVQIENLILRSTKNPTELVENKFFTFEEKNLKHTYTEGRHVLYEFKPTPAYKDNHREWQTQVAKAVEGWYFELETSDETCSNTTFVKVNMPWTYF
jgi:hypothetical protein